MTRCADTCRKVSLATHTLMLANRSRQRRSPLVLGSLPAGAVSSTDLTNDAMFAVYLPGNGSEKHRGGDTRTEKFRWVCERIHLGPELDGTTFDASRSGALAMSGSGQTLPFRSPSAEVRCPTKAEANGREAEVRSARRLQRGGFSAPGPKGSSSGCRAPRSGDLLSRRPAAENTPRASRKRATRFWSIRPLLRRDRVAAQAGVSSRQLSRSAAISTPLR
jgi:hypothetical protein